MADNVEFTMVVLRGLRWSSPSPMEISMDHRSIPWIAMDNHWGCHGVLWSPMALHGDTVEAPWSFMELHGIDKLVGLGFAHIEAVGITMF